MQAAIETTIIQAFSLFFTKVFITACVYSWVVIYYVDNLSKNSMRATKVTFVKLCICFDSFKRMVLVNTQLIVASVRSDVHRVCSMYHRCR